MVMNFFVEANTSVGSHGVVHSMTVGSEKLLQVAGVKLVTYDLPVFKRVPERVLVYIPLDLLLFLKSSYLQLIDRLRYKPVGRIGLKKILSLIYSATTLQKMSFF